jgi:hypothetical protein
VVSLAPSIEGDRNVPFNPPRSTGTYKMTKRRETMPEKKNQETHRHAWPPEAVTCYMPTYFVLKEQESGRDIFTLVRVASGKPDFMIRTRKYADLLETVIQDATIPVFSVTPRQLIEALFGEPRWKYGSRD